MKFEEILDIPPSQLEPICLKFPVETFSMSLVRAGPELVAEFLSHIKSQAIVGLIEDLAARHKDISEAEIAAARQVILAVVKDSFPK